MSPIFLVGFMCSGKTTLGKALAAATGRPFIDLDDAVEADAGMPIPRIFELHGEDFFRQCEQRALRRIASDCRDAVVACGGGTPCRPGAMEMMNGAGLTVYLEPSRDRLVARLMDGRARRPLIAGIGSDAEMRDFLDTTLTRRLPYYTMAARTFDSSGLENADEVAASVRRFIDDFIDD